ncbi:MAG: hypothetical protein AAB420_02100 [Patescibacteria group bacterium]
MMKKLLIIFVVSVATVIGYVLGSMQAEEQITPVGTTPMTSITTAPQTGDTKTFVFDSFHGSADISDKFRFQYPANWFNDGQYFSPHKIQFYNKLNVKAPIYFDLVQADVFHLTELQYQIDNSKKRNPDTTGILDGKKFTKYDLTDYGSYGGDSAGRVKIFVGPKITIDGVEYVLVFHWEELPLAEYVQGNTVEVFDAMMLSLQFYH